MHGRLLMRVQTLSIECGLQAHGEVLRPLTAPNAKIAYYKYTYLDVDAVHLLRVRQKNDAGKQPNESGRVGRGGEGNVTIGRTSSNSLVLELSSWRLNYYDSPQRLLLWAWPTIGKARCTKEWTLLQSRVCTG